MVVSLELFRRLRSRPLNLHSRVISLLRFAARAQRMRKSSARTCRRVAAESWPALRSTRIRCLINADRQRVFLRKSNNGAAPGAPASPAAPPSSAPSGPAADAHGKPAPAPKAAAKPYTVLGERFVQRSVIDTQQGGMTAATVYVPESWHFESKIEWHDGWVEVPVNPSWHAENSANAEGYFQYESLRLANVDVAPQYRRYVKPAKPGERDLRAKLTSRRSLRCKSWPCSSRTFAAK